MNRSTANILQILTDMQKYYCYEIESITGAFYLFYLHWPLAQYEAHFNAHFDRKHVVNNDNFLGICIRRGLSALTRVT